MSKTGIKRAKWTLSFDPQLKTILIKLAKRNGTYPVRLLEDIVREKINLYGYTNILNSVSYVRHLRKRSRKKTDEIFLKEIYEWQKSRS